MNVDVSHLRIRTKDGDLKPFVLTEFQKLLIEAFRLPPDMLKPGGENYAQAKAAEDMWR